MPDTLSLTFYNSSGGSWNVALPITGISVAVNINWGNGTTNTSLSNTYSGTGPYTATITITSGQVTQFGTNDPNTGNVWDGGRLLTTVTTTNNLTWGLGNYVTSFATLFMNCNTLTAVPANIPQTVTNLSGLFINATIFNDPNVSSWQVSNVTKMDNMFNSTPVFNRNIGSWDVGRVITMRGMFSGATSFNNASSNSINSWNTSRVLDMGFMFYAAYPFNQPIGSWDVSNVTDMQQMFQFANVFNQPIGNWNVGNVTTMNNMFASSVFNQYIGNWNVSNVTNMGNMFYTSNFNQNIGQWNTSNVTIMAGMFNRATTFVQFIRCWNVNKVTTFDVMFESANAMAAKYGTTTGFGTTPTADFFNGIVGLTFDVSAGTQVSFPFNGSLGTFTIDWGNGTIITGDSSTLVYTYPSEGNYGAVLTATPSASNITSFGSQSGVSTGFLNLTGFYSSQYSTWGIGTSATFISLYGASKLVSVPLTLPLNVTSTANMFFGASRFNQSISSWNIQYITDMTGMFEGASTFNQNLSSWYPRSASNMSRLFYGANAYNNGGAALMWNTSAVTNMTSMFESATNFNAGITSFNVSGVTNMTQMFKNATTFNQNIRIWVVGSTTTLTNMFYNTTAFNAVYFPTIPGYTNEDTPLYTFFNFIPVRYPCFMEGTQILCFKNNKEVYRPIQELRKGDLVKTISNGYLPIYMIGTSEFKNPGHNARVPNRLYKYTSEKYPELFEDLYITGCHSILVPFLTDEEWDNTKELLGDIFITDNHFRLMACLDENSEPYCKAAYINIYHIALENTNYYMNYGVYANGLLVESCSKRYLTELSNMRILGEEDSRLKDNVLAMNTKYNSNIAVM